MSSRQSREGKRVLSLTLGSLIANHRISAPTGPLGRQMRSTLALLTKAQAYQMLLRRNAPSFDHSANG